MLERVGYLVVVVIVISAIALMFLQLGGTVNTRASSIGNSTNAMIDGAVVQ